MSTNRERHCEPAETTAAGHEGQRRDAVEDETKAMYLAFSVLLPLDYNARRRVLRWLPDALDDIEVPF